MQVDRQRLRRSTDEEVGGTSPSDLADLPASFWEDAVVVEPVAKQPISIRLDADVLEWFRSRGPRYQSRINAVLRSYMESAPRVGPPVRKRG